MFKFFIVFFILFSGTASSSKKVEKECKEAFDSLFPPVENSKVDGVLKENPKVLNKEQVAKLKHIERLIINDELPSPIKVFERIYYAEVRNSEGNPNPKDLEYLKVDLSFLQYVFKTFGWRPFFSVKKSYEETEKIARENNIRTSQEYFDFVEKHPELNLAKDPFRFFEEFTTWGRLLGTEKKNYEETEKIARENNLKTREEYEDFVDAHPELNLYKNPYGNLEGFTTFPRLLGTEKKNYKETEKIVRENNIETIQEYHDFVDANPGLNLYKNPQNDLKGFTTWERLFGVEKLGTEKKNYEETEKIARENNLKTARQYFDFVDAHPELNLYRDPYGNLEGFTTFPRLLGTENLKVEKKNYEETQEIAKKNGLKTKRQYYAFVDKHPELNLYKDPPGQLKGFTTWGRLLGTEKLGLRESIVLLKDYIDVTTKREYYAFVDKHPELNLYKRPESEFDNFPGYEIYLSKPLKLQILEIKKLEFLKESITLLIKYPDIISRSSYRYGIKKYSELKHLHRFPEEYFKGFSWDIYLSKYLKKNPSKMTPKIIESHLRKIFHKIDAQINKIEVVVDKMKEEEIDIPAEKTKEEDIQIAEKPRDTDSKVAVKKDKKDDLKLLLDIIKANEIASYPEYQKRHPDFVPKEDMVNLPKTIKELGNYPFNLHSSPKYKPRMSQINQAMKANLAIREKAFLRGIEKLRANRQKQEERARMDAERQFNELLDKEEDTFDEPLDLKNISTSD